MGSVVGRPASSIGRMFLDQFPDRQEIRSMYGHTYFAKALHPRPFASPGSWPHLFIIP